MWWVVVQSPEHYYLQLLSLLAGLSWWDNLKREERDLCRLLTSCLMKLPTKFLVETYQFSKPVWKPVSFNQKFGRQLHQTTRQKPAEVSLFSFHVALSWETSASREPPVLIAAVNFPSLLFQLLQYPRQHPSYSGLLWWQKLSLFFQHFLQDF